MKERYDAIVIGGGPAGYPAAIRLGQHGLSVACIDDWRNHDGTRSFGGTCLNAGCIPSKALLESTELFHRAGHEFSRHGIEIERLAVDVAAMQQRKAGIVRQFTGGIETLFKGNKVDGLKGRGELLPGRRVRFTDAEGRQHVLAADHVILATGSAPIELEAAPFDGERVLDSWGALDLDAVPERLGVIGAGVIGLELGSVWQRLGAEVVLLEAMDEFLPAVDRQIAGEAEKQFRKQGLDIRLGAKVEATEVGKQGVKIRYRDAGGEQSATVDKLVVCVGRRPYTDGLFPEDVGVRLDRRGTIEVDEQCRTGIEGIWAVGDVVRGPMLAHKGTEEGIMVAELIAGRAAHVNYDAVPSVIYTAPEIAWVGRTQRQLDEAGISYRAGSVPFAINGRAHALEQAGGMVKILAAQHDGEVLGVHIVGPMAGELVAEAVLAMEYRASAEDLQHTMHAHPSLAEVVHEAALAVDKKAIHARNR